MGDGRWRPLPRLKERKNTGAKWAGGGVEERGWGGGVGGVVKVKRPRETIIPCSSVYKENRSVRLRTTAYHTRTSRSTSGVLSRDGVHNSAFHPASGHHCLGAASWQQLLRRQLLRRQSVPLPVWRRQCLARPPHPRHVRVSVRHNTSGT